MSKKLTDAKKAAIKKYLDGFSQFVVRMRPDDLERLDRAAEAAGKSRAAFVQDAVADAIEKQIGAGVIPPQNIKTTLSERTKT